MQLLATITGKQVDLTAIELVLMRCRVFSTHQTAGELSVQREGGRICLENLAELRENPSACTRNLELCESIDAAETELKTLRNCILVETTPGKRANAQAAAAALVVALSERMMTQSDGRGNTIVLLGNDEPVLDAQIALIGEVEMSGNDTASMEDKLNAAVLTSAQVGGAPILLCFAPNEFTQIDWLLQRFKEHAPNVKFILAGTVAFQPEWIQALLDNTNALFLLDAKGAHLSGEDWELAHKFAPLLTNHPTRFVLGLDFKHAIQLKRFGGDGYYLAATKFLHRLERLGVPHASLCALKRDNALPLLCFKQPAPVVPAPPKLKWTCQTCQRVREEGDDFYESHGKRFCTAKCMREFRLLNQFGSGGGDGDVFNRKKPGNNQGQGATASWGINL